MDRHSLRLWFWPVLVGQIVRGKKFFCISILLFFMLSDGAFAQTKTHIIVDGHAQGRHFDGVGAISAGASTRLLYDYPEPERSQILDYLFKPNYGASLQILKVEIGGDMNSTDGSEASHMRNPDECNCNRGYEWWLMKQAKKRNPNIKLAALEWGAPSWFENGFWSQDNIDYLLAWLDCARENGLKINYIGGGNERGYDAKWYVKFKEALNKNHPDVKLIAADQVGQAQWKVATVMKNKPSFNAAIDIIGQHSPCGDRRNPHYQKCVMTKDALSFKKPLWSSELSSLAHNTGAIPIARALNRSYIDGKITGQMIWPAVSAWYADLPIAGTGPILAEWPWSGYYEVGKSVWSLAHTTQFTKPGWHYLNSGSSSLKSGATVVSLVSPAGGDYSMIIETTDMQKPEETVIHLKNLPDKELQVWKTDIGSNDPQNYFQHTRTIIPKGSHFRLTLEPDYVYTITTHTNAGKGKAKPRAGIADQLYVPFHANFEEYKNEQLSRYFSDISGGFQTESCQAGRAGMCYEQVVSVEPIPWHGADMSPTTVVGDPRWWGDYRISADVLLKENSSVELLGRVDGIGGDEFVSAYHLQIAHDGKWCFYSEDVTGEDTTLAVGQSSFRAGSWHNLVLYFEGSTIRISVDGNKMATIQDDRHRTGQVGFRVGEWKQAQFDNLQVTPITPQPDFVPLDKITATATSVHPGNTFGYFHPVSAAIDGRPETYWRSEWDPLALFPQSITLDLGKVCAIDGLTYQPKISGNWAEKIGGNPITNYTIYLSNDSKNFKKVASGTWRNTMAATKVAKWNQNYEARYIRLEATKGSKNGITVGEVKVIQTNPESSKR